MAISGHDIKILQVTSPDLGKISTQPHPTICIQFLNRENNDKNNAYPIVWGCAETLPLIYINVYF